MCCKKIRHGLLIISLFFVIISVSMAGCSLTNSQTTSTSLTTLTTTPNVPTITASNAYILVTQNLNNPTFVVIDARTAGEFNSGHIVGAMNIDYESPQFTADVSQLDKNKIYLVYCATGIRGAAATQIIVSQGFKDVQNMEGGITAWIQDGYPVIALTTTGTTTSQTTAAVLTTTSTLPNNGLQLQFSVNTTILTPGEPLQINVSEYNTLSTDNNVAAATNWGTNGLVIGACPNLNTLPFGVAIFQGSYDTQNVSQGAPLEIYGAVPCPQLIRLITGYDFLPDSSNAAVMPGGDLASLTPMSATITVNGAYKQGMQLTPLSSGIYTVVAGDEWGTLEFLFISVN